jgi:hypothetical protein
MGTECCCARRNFNELAVVRTLDYHLFLSVSWPGQYFYMCKNAAIRWCDLESAIEIYSASAVDM